MSEQGEQVPQDAGGQQEELGAYLAPGSSEDRMLAELSEVVQRHPELSEERYAAGAGATAAHIARELGNEALASDPMILELAHLANVDAERADQAVQAAQPPDPVDAILRGGRGGIGGKVLDF